MTTTPAAVEALKLADEELTDAEYVLSMIDETFASVPQIKAHHDRIRRIAAALAQQPPANTPAHTPPTGVSGAVQAKREPLTMKQKSDLFDTECSIAYTVWDDFIAGVEAAERAHGIGAAGEGAGQ